MQCYDKIRRRIRVGLSVRLKRTDLGRRDSFRKRILHRPPNSAILMPDMEPRYSYTFQCPHRIGRDIFKRKADPNSLGIRQ
jgi:hypothetical protein